MQPKATEKTASGFTPADIYFLVFRHKWKIALGVVLGVAAAAYIYVTMGVAYQSEAKILVRYVAERSSINPAARENIRSPDSGGQSIINSEIQILTSRDLAEEVARVVGPEKILGQSVADTNEAAAANQIVKNLKAEVPLGSSVIAIKYEHSDPRVAQLVLKLLVEKYTEKHLEIHRALGAYEFLATQTDRLRQQLMQTESDLRTFRTNAGVISLDGAKTSLAAEMAHLRTTIMQEEADLEARRALLPLSTNSASNSASATNPATAQLTQTAPRDAGVYRALCTSLDGLRARELEMVSVYTDKNPTLIAVRAQIAELSKRKQEMEAADPSLTMAVASMTAGGDKAIDFADPAFQVLSIQAKIKVLKMQWERVRADAAALDSVEGSIRDLERRKAVEEENYKAFSTSLEKARIDQAIDASKLTSISIVQAASLPARTPGRRSKPAGMALAGGIAFGVLLALFSEFILNPTVKRPGEFKRSSVPVMLTIPALEKRRRRRRRSASHSDISHVDSLPTVADPAHPMRPYFEALRDRLLLHFEGNNKKPKLVGVTACDRGAGTSSLAAGLAAAMSETGDGNVLLVDMNFEQGSAHQFFKGKPVCALNEAVEEETRSSGEMQQNLYLASINQASANDKLNANGATEDGKGNALEKHSKTARLVPSKQIAEMMPKLKTSDYDYIIFDMPPITPTSITFRMSGLMDKVLLVVESERTHRDTLAMATALLGQAKAKADAVLNRQQRHMPRFLSPELSGTTAS